jgi:hypothetical protein
LARQKYGLEKRQRELAKERKKEEKLQRKLGRTSDRPTSDDGEETQVDSPPEA